MTYDGASSKLLSQSLGVIQGSKTGPLLYDIYSNDINHLCGDRENILFADDTCLTYVGDDLSSLAEHVNERLALIADWCRSNKLSINPTKSEYIIVTTKHVALPPTISIGGDVVSYSKRVKYLGLNIDDGLKFTPHINHVIGKLSRLCGVANRLSEFFNKNTAKTFYYSCVYSAVTYCISVWGGALSSCRGAKLVSLHDRIIKVLFKKYNNEMCPYKVLGILKLRDIHELYVGLHMYKVVNGFSGDVGGTLDLQRAAHVYSTRNRDQYITPFPRVNAIRTSYKYQFISVWNRIPTSICIEASVKRFKSSFVSYVISKY